MTLIDKLKKEYPEISDWQIKQGVSSEKERNNQSTEATEFIATSPDNKSIRNFVYTLFTNHKGSKESWSE